MIALTSPLPPLVFVRESNYIITLYILFFIYTIGLIAQVANVTFSLVLSFFSKYPDNIQKFRFIFINLFGVFLSLASITRLSANVFVFNLQPGPSNGMYSVEFNVRSFVQLFISTLYYIFLSFFLRSVKGNISEFKRRAREEIKYTKRATTTNATTTNNAVMTTETATISATITITTDPTTETAKVTAIIIKDVETATETATVIITLDTKTETAATMAILTTDNLSTANSFAATTTNTTDAPSLLNYTSGDDNENSSAISSSASVYSDNSNDTLVPIADINTIIDAAVNYSKRLLKTAISSSISLAVSGASSSDYPHSAFNAATAAFRALVLDKITVLVASLRANPEICVEHDTAAKMATQVIDLIKTAVRHSISDSAGNQPFAFYLLSFLDNYFIHLLDTVLDKVAELTRNVNNFEESQQQQFDSIKAKVIGITADIICQCFADALKSSARLSAGRLGPYSSCKAYETAAIQCILTLVSTQVSDYIYMIKDDDRADN